MTFCKDCKHYVQGASVEIDRCGRIFYVDPVRGDKHYEVTCVSARSKFSPMGTTGEMYEGCGPDNPRFFEPKEPQ